MPIRLLAIAQPLQQILSQKELLQTGMGKAELPFMRLTAVLPDHKGGVAQIFFQLVRGDMAVAALQIRVGSQPAAKPGFQGINCHAALPTAPQFGGKVAGQ